MMEMEKMLRKMIDEQQKAINVLTDSVLDLRRVTLNTSNRLTRLEKATEGFQRTPREQADE